MSTKKTDFLTKFLKNLEKESSPFASIELDELGQVLVEFKDSFMSPAPHNAPDTGPAPHKCAPAIRFEGPDTIVYCRDCNKTLST